MHKVSMIMPVYNSEMYLRDAIESIVSQKFDSFELILVDDGSKDSSGQICDEYQSRCPEIRVIHQKNRGISAARNAGLDMADGEYVGFCDNDDVLLPGALAENYRRAKEEDLDLMRYNSAKRYEKDGKVWESVLRFPEATLSREDFAGKYRVFLQNPVWTAFYRRSIIDENGIRFNEKMRCGNEDTLFNLQFAMHCEKVGYTPAVYHWWQQRDIHSTSRKFSREGAEAWFLCLPFEYTVLKETCRDQVSNYEKNRRLIDLYVFQMVDYLNIPGCDLSAEEKSRYLRKLRNAPVFDKALSSETAALFWKESKRSWMVLKLFYGGRYRLLLWVVKTGTAVLDYVRFRQHGKEGKHAR